MVASSSRPRPPHRRARCAARECAEGFPAAARFAIVVASGRGSHGRRASAGIPRCDRRRRMEDAVLRADRALRHRVGACGRRVRRRHHGARRTRGVSAAHRRAAERSDGAPARGHPRLHRRRRGRSGPSGLRRRPRARARPAPRPHARRADRDRDPAADRRGAAVLAGGARVRRSRGRRPARPAWARAVGVVPAARSREAVAARDAHRPRRAS